jgi:glyoxylase-like metal-dependent hydrolase (beta-lactamase superfamily II)
MADLKIAPGGSAAVYVLHEGYAGRDGDDERVAGTVTLIIDGDAVIVVDPGMVASRPALLAALSAHGPQAGDVTDVVFSHHHPDHTVNAALFPEARIHDHWAIYAGDRWLDRDAGGAHLGPSVRPAAAHARAYRRGHFHDRVHAGRSVRVHARVVGRERSRR